MVATAEDDFAALLRSVLDDDFHCLVAEADRTRRFPREILTRLGSSGVFAAKWSRGADLDLHKLVLLSTSVGALGSAGISVGISLHDSAIAMLRRFGVKSEYLSSIATDAIAGRAVMCIGASESGGGSDLQAVTSTATRRGDGFVLSGAKKFVSLSPIADFAVIVARCVDDHAVDRRWGNVGLFVLPMASAEVGEVYDKVGAASLDTAPIEFDAWIPESAMLARAGTGLAALTWGLSHERVSIAGQVAGACERVLGVTVARMMRREQFGQNLFAHQALRLRVADLQARVDVLRLALEGLAGMRQIDLRTAAALKVSAARLGEEVVGECMHIFGGSGYLLDEGPIGRWWQDMRLSRLGGGSDEVLWELVAAGMTPDYSGYEALFGTLDSSHC
ncbi:acyl-CoA dehydrogenase family protein [Nocardia sp. BMG51109]|uniref:acyl-CoA dehydrogenase family protein n=1 Tax=Nocardia sp. BMG51109 TaxID=1056816 RepID=UPI000464EE00|nr:acyl-CoA dehydrogenase family protein [Nocardia sp. BMG51109]